MSCIKILVCAHKNVAIPKHPYFLPLQAGAALHPKIDGFQPDDEGANISTRNPHFCELTCHYWAWKNLKGVDIIGLNHYRRFFDFERKWPLFTAPKRFSHTQNFLKWPYRFPDLEQLLSQYDIILPSQRHWLVSNTRQYESYHVAQDWETLRNIITERSGEYIPAFEHTMDRSNKASGYNMFITKWETFNKYSKWLFDILFEVERRIPPTTDPIQSRIYGYMSERLINVFCYHHKLRIKYVPLIMPIDEHVDAWELNPSNLHWCYQRIKNDITFFLKNRLL